MVTASVQDKIVLYDSGNCPYAQRAWLTMEEKQLPYEHRIVSLSDKPKEFTDLYKTVNPNPEASAKVPIIIDTDGTKMIESLIVAEYLDEKYPDSGTKLMPSSAADRAKVRLFIDTYNNTLGPITYGILRVDTEEALQEQIAKLSRALQVLNTFLEVHGTQDGGDYLLGGQYSMAELATTPFVSRLVKAMPVVREQVDVMAMVQDAGLTRLQAWIQAVLARPSASSTGGGLERMAEGLKKFVVPLKVNA